MYVLRSAGVTSPTLPSQLGSPPLTLLLMPPGGLRSPVGLRVRKMFPDDVPKEFLQAGTYPWETKTHNRSSLSLTGAPHPTLGTARMFHALLWQQCPHLLALSMWDHSCLSSCALVLVPSVCTRVCTGGCECQAPIWQQIGGRNQHLTNSFPGRARMREGTNALCQPTQFHPVLAWISQTS